MQMDIGVRSGAPYRPSSATTRTTASTCATTNTWPPATSSANAPARSPTSVGKYASRLGRSPRRYAETNSATIRSIHVGFACIVRFDNVIRRLPAQEHSALDDRSSERRDYQPPPNFRVQRPGSLPARVGVGSELGVGQKFRRALGRNGWNVVKRSRIADSKAKSRSTAEGPRPSAVSSSGDSYPIDIYICRCLGLKASLPEILPNWPAAPCEAG